MKRIYLMRHAKSDWDNPDIDDFDRPLNEQGQADVPVMGKRLRDQNITPDLVISSPANRALTTATIIAEYLSFPKAEIVSEPLIYENTVNALLQVIHDIVASVNQVMLFGHNPSFSQLIDYFCEEEESTQMPTCGVAGIELVADDWQAATKGGGKLFLFDYLGRS